MARTIDLDMPSLTRHITVKVHVRRMRWFQVKVRIALFFMRIGALIGGFGFETTDDLDG